MIAADLQGLQSVLYSEITLAKAIGIEVREYNESGLTLCAPLENNLNHKRTAFGGSIYSVSVLAGWGLIYLLLQERELAGQIVIQESSTRFIKPVTASIVAQCAFESAGQVERFIRALQRKRVARIQLQSNLISSDGVSAVFDGTYVVHCLA